MEKPEVVLVDNGGYDTAALRKALTRHNVTIIGAGLAAGMSLDAISALCVPLDTKPREPAPLTKEDRRRIAAAEEKRARRAAKRVAAGA